MGSLDIAKDKFLEILRRICAAANETILVHPLGIVHGELFLLSNSVPLEDREAECQVYKRRAQDALASIS